MSETTSSGGDEYLNAKIIYGLFALGYFTAITSIAGLIYAYVARGNHAGLDTHLTYLIHTFWITLVVAIIGFVLAYVGIGFLILLGLFIWSLIRLISGFVVCVDNKPISKVVAMGAFAR